MRMDGISAKSVNISMISRVSILLPFTLTPTEAAEACKGRRRIITRDSVTRSRAFLPILFFFVFVFGTVRSSGFTENCVTQFHIPS